MFFVILGDSGVSPSADEKGLFAAFAVVFVSREEQQADGNLRGIEKLARQRNHTTQPHTFTGEEPGASFLEGIGDVFEKDESDDYVLVFHRVHIAAELIGCQPELGFKAEIGGGVVVFRFGDRHQVSGERVIGQPIIK